MIVVEVVGADDTGVLKAFYLSQGPMVTGAGDLPEHTAFQPVLKDPGSIGISAFGDGLTGGGTRLEVGEVKCVNLGRLDDLKNYGFDGQSVVIRQGEPGTPYPSAWKVMFRGTVDYPEFTWRYLTFRLRDKQFIFDRPCLQSKYTGANALPSGAEGVATDLKGKYKPQVFGIVKNIEPYLVNTSKLTFQVSNGAVYDIPQVYDRGVSITKGADYANLAALEAASPSAATYITCKALGLFRLGSSPTGIVTANVQGRAPGTATASQVLIDLATQAGIPYPSGFSTDDAGILALENSADVGIWVEGDTSFREAMDTIAGSVGAYYGFDVDDILRMARLSLPSGIPDAVLTPTHYRRSLELRAANDTGIPAWSVTCLYGKNYRTQTSDLAGSVTAARRAELREEFLSAVFEVATVKLKHKLATELMVTTHLVSEAAAIAEATRIQAMFGTRRDIVEVTVPASTIPDNSLRLLRVVSLVSGRFGMSGGKLFRIIGMRLELGRNRVVLTLWG